jgi:hypothetical protein
LRIKEIFETKIEEKIEPVIKIGERQNEAKLAAEVGSYVVTPTIERYLDDFLEHYTDTIRVPTTEVGVWISGYFGSGKSHLAKIVAMLIENRNLEGMAVTRRFESRIPAAAPRRDSIVRSLSRLSQCDSRVLAFNLNSLADSKTTPLSRLLLSQFYQSKGYGANFLYARVIEAELDKRGKLQELHETASRLANKPWEDIHKNPNFYSKPLYQAACEVAPDVFSSPEEVTHILKSAESGEIYNVQFLVRTILDDLEAREKEVGKPCRLVLVMDESGQWIEDDGGRLSQLQALVEEAAIKGQGKLWVFITTHEDMGSIYKNARNLKADMKTIEARFRFKWNLTTENIELVLEDRLFKKKLAGQLEVKKVYNENPGVLRDICELKNTSQKLPECSEDRFVTFYPFSPYQIHLIPEIVKSLRSAGGRGEQLSGSTRTLLAITQDILRAGRRSYLSAAVGEMVSFDEVYNNLAGEGEVNPNVRRELSRIEDVVPNSTLMTRRVAEVLYLIREITYIPRTIDNLSRLMVENTSEDMTVIRGKVEPELSKLISAKLVAKIGEEYEFLTGVRRTFEEEVAAHAAGLKRQDLEAGLAKFASTDVLGFETVSYKGSEFSARIFFDDTQATKEGFTDIRIASPLSALAGTKVSDLEDQSLRPDEQQTIFVLCDRIPGFDEQLKYYLAMRVVIDIWKGDPHKSAEALKLASDREANDLEKLKRRVIEGIRDSLKRAQVVFRGSARAVSPKGGLTPGEVLRAEIVTFWPKIYSKFEKVPVKIINEQRSILDVLKGTKDLSTDVRELRLFDKAGHLDPGSPLLDALRLFLFNRQSKKERILGRELIAEFEKPPYGWDPGAVRVGVAAFVRSGVLRVLINKKPFTNPADSELQDALRVSRSFDKVELILEETEVDADVLTEVRTLLIKLVGKRKIDETPAALSAEMDTFGRSLLDQALMTSHWAAPARMPLPNKFTEGKEAFEKLIALSNPIHRVNQIFALKDELEGYVSSIRSVSGFVDKWGKAFTDMQDFAQSLEAVEYRLTQDGECVSFLDNWRTAVDGTSVTTESTWRDLQNAKAGAGIELERMLSSWRDDARGIVQGALDRLPEELNGSHLNAELQESLAAPLNTFINSLDSETAIARVAALPDRAGRLVRELGIAIQSERDKLVPPPDNTQPHDPPTQPAKPVKQIRVAEVASFMRIRSEDQWNQIRDRLDETVKRELTNGNEVEIG